MLGGPLCIVHADETILNFKTKSHRGGSGPQKWGFCIVDVFNTPSKIFCCGVVNRTARTLVGNLGTMFVLEQLFIPMNGVLTTPFLFFRILS
jgi:hypothetical protein